MTSADENDTAVSKSTALPQTTSFPPVPPVSVASDVVPKSVKTGTETETEPGSIDGSENTSDHIQEENLIAELAQRKASLQYNVLTLRNRINIAQEKHATRLSNLVNNHNALVEDLTNDHNEAVKALQTELSDSEKALDIVSKVLGDVTNLT